MIRVQILTPTIHGVLDYAAAAGLIVFTVLLGFEGVTLWLSLAGGVGLVGYSLLTDYAFSVANVFSFRTHLTLDLSAAVLFLTAPFAFGWKGLVMGYYFTMAAGVIVVVLFSQNAPVIDDASKIAE